MKLTRKLLALALVLCMVCSLSITAFAATEEYPADTTTDATDVNIPVTYYLVGAGTSPAETFTLTGLTGSVTNGEATSAPNLLGITGAVFTAGAATTQGAVQNINVQLPTYDKVGVYEYVLTPVVGNTAGVTYRPATETVKLVVTVIDDGKIRVAAVHTETEGGTKTNGISYTYSASSMSVTKNVTGNLGDKKKDFQMTVTFSGQNVKEDVKYSVAGVEQTAITPSDWANGKATATITLKHGQTATFTEIPYGVTYAVDEDDYTAETPENGYKAPVYTYSDNNKKIDSTDTDTVTVTNEKTGTVDTGIVLDSMPYILTLALAVIGGAALVMKKRYSI